MLSYQHAYHAGNCADVHKHLVLLMLLRYLQLKPAPICFVDAHAGRGLYDLESAEASKTREAADGILRLAVAVEPPAPVADYLALVGSFNDNGRMRRYPGSSELARALLRDQDRAVLLELHPQEFAALRTVVRHDRRVAVHARDCYEGLPALLPPAIRRGLVLIDPSYEVKTEYARVVALLDEAITRWHNAIHVLWYPLLPEARHRRLLRDLRKRALPPALASEFCFADAREGLYGSGLVIVNPPWQFPERLQSAMHFVAATLGRDGTGRHEQRWLAGGPDS